MASTFNLSNFSANSIANSALNIAAVFGGATLTIYGPSQPANANTVLSGQLALAIFTLPAAGSNTVTNPSNNALITFGAISNVTASQYRNCNVLQNYQRSQHNLRWISWNFWCGL